jgi:hypothetical protein
MNDDFYRRRDYQRRMLEALEVPRSRRRELSDEELVSEREGEDDEIAGEMRLAADVARAIPRGDELMLKAGIRDARWEELNAKANFVRITPPSAQKGKLGGYQSVYSDGPALEVASWVADSDTEVSPVTITLTPVQQIILPGVADASKQDPNALANAQFRPYAIIRWGIRGGPPQEAEVDIGMGCQFTIGANFVTVLVALEPRSSALVSVATMQLGGALSFYPIVRTKPITRTRYMEGDLQTFEVPAFAKDLIVYRFSTGGATAFEPFEIDFMDVYDTVLYIRSFAAGGFMEIPVLLSPDVARVYVGSTTGGPLTRARLIFGLEL